MTLEALKATPRVKSIQRPALAMQVLAGVIDYIDRAALAVANLLIRQDLGLSIADMGYLLSAFHRVVQQTGSFVPALVVGGLIGVASAGSYLFVVDQPITAADIDAVSQHGAAPAPAAGG
jgi:hypothetical protein